MSLQVGLSCYATPVDAGVAACSAFAPLSGLVTNGAVLRTVSCVSADQATGALNLQITSTPVDGSAGTVAYVSQSVSYPQCNQADYVAAGEIVFGAFLALWCSVYGLNEIRKMLHWSRADS